MNPELTAAPPGLDFDLTEEQLAVREMVRDFAEREVRPVAAEIDRTHEFPMANVRKMAELGSGSGSAGDSDAQDLPAGLRARYRMSYTGGSSPSLTLVLLGTTAVGDPEDGKEVLLRVARNPSRGRMRIEYGLSRKGAAVVECFDVAGRRLRRWVVNHPESGVGHIEWDGSDEAGVAQSAGVYFVRMRTEGHARTARGVFLR
jgi:hypothetical protein